VTASLRAFLAIEVAPEIHAALVDLKRELARFDTAVRWVRDEGLHATLKFLGSVRPETLAALRASLAEALGDFPPLTVRVAGLGAFPNLHRPRVVWVGLIGPDLPALARQIETAAAAFGFPAESRPFHPHITLGRVGGPHGWPRLLAALQEHWTDDIGVCDITDLVAYRSNLQRGGAVYTKLWTIPLAGRRKGEDHGS
jgi:2'-5' RNA ligase